MNALRAAFLGCSFLLVAVSPPSSDKNGEFATSFCPECWKFLRSKDAADKDGTCRTCGKISVAVDACDLTWYWCPDHDFWHRRPCPDGRSRRSWRTRTATALVVALGDERLQKAAYCPECRIFPDPMRMERGMCPFCGVRLAAVDAIEPVWFWCNHELHWKEDPCPQNGTSHCCALRTGTLPAKQRVVTPEANAIHGR